MPDSSPDLAQEGAAFLAAYPDAQTIDAFVSDLSGVVRGKRYPIAQLDKILRDGLALPGSVFLLDVLGESHDPAGMGFSDGDPDYKAVPLPGSLLPVPWLETPGGQLMLTLVESDGTPYRFEPRNVLARVVSRLREQGLHPVVAFELEFYLIDPERRRDGAPQPPRAPLTGRRDKATQVYGMASLESFAPILGEIGSACTTQGVTTGAISAEYAPGQFEINLHHVTDPLLAADHCVWFKRAVQGVARRHGLQASFMAKPYLDSAGSGLHMHCSLLDGSGRNVFDGGAESASQTLKHALGGALRGLPEAMAFLAPNINSFRRFQPNLFVPVSRSWGFENRSVALRIPRGPGSARRIEHRVAGADANPYLALASFLAGVHYGIERQIDPGPPEDGNAGEQVDPSLPLRPRRALDRLAETEILADYFSQAYVTAYAACKHAELDKFESEIQPHEYRWYLQAD